MPRDPPSPKPVRYPRNRDLDPQLVWRGKDEQDWDDLVVQAPSLYIQERVQPKMLIDDLTRTSRRTPCDAAEDAVALFGPPHPSPDLPDAPEGVQNAEF